jgi:hypothetical protein
MDHLVPLLLHHHHHRREASLLHLSSQQLVLLPLHTLDVDHLGIFEMEILNLREGLFDFRSPLLLLLQREQQLISFSPLHVLLLSFELLGSDILLGTRSLPGDTSPQSIGRHRRKISWRKKKLLVLELVEDYSVISARRRMVGLVLVSLTAAAAVVVVVVALVDKNMHQLVGKKKKE